MDGFGATSALISSELLEFLILIEVLECCLVFVCTVDLNTGFFVEFTIMLIKWKFWNFYRFALYCRLLVKARFVRMMEKGIEVD